MIDESGNLAETEKARSKPTLGAYQVNLVFLLLLIACTAIIASLIQMSVFATRDAKGLLPQVMAKTGFAGGFLGLFVGFFIERRWRSGVVGCITGLIVGAIGGVLGSIGGEQTSRINQIAFLGSFAMIALVLVYARSGSRIDGRK